MHAILLDEMKEKGAVREHDNDDEIALHEGLCSGV